MSSAISSVHRLLSERTQSALSKAGYKVGHLDANPYYGADDASLSVDEIIQWADERQRASTEQQATTYLASQRGRFTGISYSGDVPLHSRQFALSLCPTIIPSIGPLIENLIASGVSRYGGFKLLEQVALYEGPGVAKPVPGNKEDIFKNKQLSLVHKRRLMRFLMFAGGEFEGKPELEGNEETPFPTFLKDKFSLDDDALKAITYALAFCVFDSGECPRRLLTWLLLSVSRPNATCTASHTPVSPIYWAVWTFAFPLRALRRRRRARTRVLQNCCRRRCYICSWTTSFGSAGC